MVLVAVWFVSFPLVLHHAGIASRSSSNRVEDWVPSEHPETRELDRLIELFRSDELLAVSWPPKPAPPHTLDDPRFKRLRRWGTAGSAQDSESSGGRAGIGYVTIFARS